MKFTLSLVIIAILFVGTSPAFAETLTNPTDLGSVDVRLTYDEIVPGQLACTLLAVDQVADNRVHDAPSIERN